MNFLLGSRLAGAGLLLAVLLVSPAGKAATEVSVEKGDGNLYFLLWAIHQQEASGKVQVPSRYEPQFYERYIKGNSEFAQAVKRYGKEAVASSYGPWQIMYPTAVEMGYQGRPGALSDAAISLPYVIKYLRKLETKFGDDTAKIIHAYNAGPGSVRANGLAPARTPYTSKVLAYLDSISSYN